MAWAIRMPMLKRMKDPAKSEEDMVNLLYQCSRLEGQRTCTVKMIQPLRNSSSASDDFQSQRLACDRGNCGLADARLQAQRLHRTYVSVPRSLDHVRFESVSFRAIFARQNRPSAVHMAATRHRFAASRATNPKLHSPLAVFATRELMTSGAFRPLRHRPISSAQLPTKVESARTLGGSGTSRS